jgi:hypothetical protein
VRAVRAEEVSSAVDKHSRAACRLEARLPWVCADQEAGSCLGGGGATPGMKASNLSLSSKYLLFSFYFFPPEIVLMPQRCP